MVIFIKKSVLLSLFCIILFGGILSFLAYSSVYAIKIDDKPICYVSTYQDGRKVLKDFLGDEKKQYGEAAKVKEKISVDYQTRHKGLALVETTEAQALLKKNTSLEVEFKKTVVIPAETKMLPSENMPYGTEEVISQGKDGEKENTVHAVIVNEDIKETEVVASEVVEEPKNTVILQGVNPVFHDVSLAGGFGVSTIPMPGVISAVFGSKGNLWSKAHTGLDIAAPEGTEIKSIGSGIVVTAEVHPCYGNFVAVDHGNGIITRYAHMSSIAVNLGDVVDSNTVLGYCGSTGNATGSHLHFEVLENNVAVNPESYFSKSIG